MISVECNEYIKNVQRRLGNLKNKAPLVLKKAVNDTAKQARKELVKKAKESYSVKTARFNRSMTIKKANTKNLAAIIESKGKALNLADFKVSPPEALKLPEEKPDTLTGKVLKKGRNKTYIFKDQKAFVVKYDSGHIAIVTRKEKKSLPLSGKPSPSIPQMIGSEKHVFGIVKPNIQDNLKANLAKRIDEAIQKAGNN